MATPSLQAILAKASKAPANNSTDSLQAILAKASGNTPAPQAPVAPQTMAQKFFSGVPNPGTPSVANAKYAAGQLPGELSDIGTKLGFGPVMSGMSSDFAKRKSNVDVIDSSNQNLPSKILQDVGQGAAGIGDAATDVIKPAISPNIKNDIKSAISAVGNTPAAQALGKAWDAFEQAHPEAAGNVKAIGNIASILPIGGLGEAGDMAAKAGEESADASIQAMKDTAKSGVESVRTSAAKGKLPLVKGLDEQVKTSAERLKSSGVVSKAKGAAPTVNVVKKPLVDTYDEFASQEAKHFSDIKADPAISMVGSRIGDAFKSVVKMRQDAGKVMSSELAKIGKKATDIKGAFGNFQDELRDSGASFDSITKELSTGSDSKFGSSDKQVLEKYASELQGLGNKPTVKQLDAFLGRMPNEIQALKTAKGITFKTNAERLVSNNMNDLRDALGKSATPTYNSARSQYSKLSDFVKEGAPFLGKVTQSGDFAKDASLAKSAVQSVLNNGKKDWLIKLEDLTGYHALDEATLSLQAMKDVGDFKGNSLIELLTEGGGVPTPHGAILKGLGAAGNAIKKKVIGSAADQTRAYLRSLEQ